MATSVGSGGVTASQATSGQQYGLLTNKQNRPMPNALKPHIMPSNGSGVNGGRRGSRQSGTGSLGGTASNFGGAQDSKAALRHGGVGAPPSNKSGGMSQLMAAGASTISASKLPGSKHASKQGFFDKSNGLMAANTALGRLPTLGLNQIKLEEFQDDDNNMFRVHKKTEHLLVARELEREFKDLNKFEKDNLRIWEKGISTRIDRPGTIRVINSIPALKPEFDKKKGLGGAGVQSQEELQANNLNKQKLNIFDAQDSQVLKAETLQRLGHDEKALVPADQQSHASSVFSSQKSEASRPKTIEYLNKGRQQKETVRDFIDNSRKILMAQIQINQKTEETELLREYIIMEKDKLDEGKKTFQEDKEKYEKFKMDLQQKSHQTEEEVRQKQKQIEELSNKINELKKQDGEIQSKMSKVEEEITQHKAHKKFLDLIAIASKNKKPVNQKQRKQMKATMETAENNDYDSLDEQPVTSTTRENQATFLTQQQTVVMNKSKSRSGLKQMPAQMNQGKVPSFYGKSGTAQFEDEMGEPYATRGSALTGSDQKNESDGEFNTSDIDFNASYSDDDDRIPLEEKQLGEYLKKLEENNLFEMNLFQDRQETLEKMEREAQQVIEARRAKITELDTNIALLQESWRGRTDKLAYYKNMLDHNSQRQGGAAAGKNTATGRGSAFNQATKPAKPGAKNQQATRDRSALAQTIDQQDASMTAAASTGGFAGRKQQNAFDTYLYGIGANKPEVQRINASINKLLKLADVKQEDMSDQISLLKKVEIKFHELVEMRKVYDFFEPKELRLHEQRIKIAAKEAHTKNLKSANERVEEERNAKLEKDIEAKKNLVVSKNIRTTFRSRKPDLKAKKKETDKVPPEVEQMRRYLGIDPEDWQAPHQQQNQNHQQPTATSETEQK